VRWALLVLVLALAACDGPSPGSGRSTEELADLTLESSADPVTGALAGEPFEAADAYYRVFRAGASPRVDLVFADVAQDDCGLPLPREGRRVFVRFDGLTDLPEGETEIDRDEGGDVSLHYERQIEGRWVGVGEGVARLEIDRVGRSRAVGRLNVCFDDGEGSCISGAFTARYCTSRLDGFLPREGTGTSDPPSAAESAGSPPIEGAGE